MICKFIIIYKIDILLFLVFATSCSLSKMSSKIIYVTFFCIHVSEYTNKIEKIIQHIIPLKVSCFYPTG